MGFAPAEFVLTVSRTPFGLPFPSFCCQVRLSFELTLPSSSPFAPDADLRVPFGTGPIRMLALKPKQLRGLPQVLRCWLTLPSVALQHFCRIASAPGHGRCRSRVACTSPKDAGIAAWELRLRTCARLRRLGGPARGFAPVLHQFQSTVFRHITKNYRDFAATSFAVRFKGFCPQRARGRERLSHR